MDPYAYMGDDPKAYVPHPWEQKLGTPSVGDDVIPRSLKVLAESPSGMDSAIDIDKLLSMMRIWLHA